jgi:NtrC-family two-component system response regulator AlgB
MPRRYSVKETFSLFRASLFIMTTMQPQKARSPMRILIVDDEENIRRIMVVVLEAMGHETVGVDNGAAARQQLENDTFDIAFLDLKLGGENGLDLLPELLKVNPELEVIVFTAYASIETAVEAMRRGAVDYIPKPFTPEQVRQVVGRLIQARKLRSRVAELESRISADTLTADLTTCEPAMQKALDLAFKAAATPATILLLGESGTGKTVIARALHESSPQKDNAFVTVSCPSLSRELLRANCSAMPGAHSPARWPTRWARSRWRMAARCFSMKSGKCRWRYNPSCCGYCRRRNMNASGKPGRATPTCG